MWENQNFRLAAAFLVGIVVGAGGYWTVARRSLPSVDTLSQVPLADAADESEGGASTSAMLLMGDQTPGKKVVVGQTNFSKPMWVAIHDYEGGKIGNTLGAALFDKGKRSGSIELLRATVNGKTYAAVVHTDDGNYKQYDYKKDTPLTDAGKPVMVTFTATNAD